MFKWVTLKFSCQWSCVCMDSKLSITINVVVLHFAWPYWVTNIFSQNFFKILFSANQTDWSQEWYPERSEEAKACLYYTSCTHSWLGFLKSNHKNVTLQSAKSYDKLAGHYICVKFEALGLPLASQFFSTINSCVRSDLVFRLHVSWPYTSDGQTFW